MTGPPTHLTVFFTATAGKQAEDLGTDESHIVLIVYLVYDLLNNKILAVQQHYVRPNTEGYSDSILTEDCVQITGLQEEFVKNAQPLDQVLDEMDRFFKVKGIHPDCGGNSFVLCTDGPQHLRSVFHPEATTKGISITPYMYQYFDLRREFNKLYKRPGASVADMLDFLGLEADQSIDYGVKKVHEMATIIKRLLNDGHQFTGFEIIKDRLEPGICNKNDYVDDDTVIRARGLPWQSSDSDIARFFRGLNIARGGVALCLSQQGRRNGEALIRFENKESRDLALKKHKHHLGNRYIEVYKASGKDFLNVAGGSNSEAQAFLSRGAHSIVRMRGLPYTATAEQVLTFFRTGDKTVEVLHGIDGILFVHQADGRATGDAFVLFATDEDSNVALSKHRESIGSRYIELFKSTTAEVQQVLNRTMEPPNQHHTPPIDTVNIPAMLPQLPFLPLHQPALQPGLPGGNASKDCIRLRGLPFEANVTDILAFLGEHARNIVYQGVHMVYNAAGSPSGEAFIQMDSELAAESAAMNRHKKFMLLASQLGNKKRYIEVFQCSSADMNIVLTNPELPGGLANLSPQTSASTIAAAPVAYQQQQQQPQQPQAVHQQQQQPFTLPLMQGMAQRQQQLLASPNNGSMFTAAALGGYQFPGAAQIPGATPQQQAALNPQIYAQLAAQQQQQQQLVMSQQFPQMAAAAAGQRPGLYGASPILYYYPSPPISPQSYYGAATGELGDSAASVAAAAGVAAATAQQVAARQGEW